MAELESPRPSEMTVAEIEALPEGPFPEPAGASVCAKGISDDDLMAYTDSRGRSWQFGQWSNGQWFKQRVW